MKKVLSLLINISLLFSLTACGNNATADMIENTTLSSNVVSEKDLGSQGMEQSERQQQTEDSDMNNTTILVAYFSRTGENYNVGNIEKGNTHIVADMIAEQTGGDTFEISTVTPYPDNYDECTDIARQEQNENARPEFSVIQFGGAMCPWQSTHFLKVMISRKKPLFLSVLTKAADLHQRKAVLQQFAQIQRLWAAFLLEVLWLKNLKTRLKPQ